MRTSFQATRPQNFNLVLREQTTNITIRPCLHKRVRVNYITCKSGSYRTEYRYNTSAYKNEPLKGTRNFQISLSTLQVTQFSLNFKLQQYEIPYSIQLFAFFALASAQNITIGYPTPWQMVYAGSLLTVQVIIDVCFVSFFW